MAIQFRRLEQLEAGETQVTGQLFGVYRGFFIVEQRRAEMHLARFTGLGVDTVHAHGRLETHADVEELHVQLTVQFFPQRMVAVIADSVEILWRHGRQGRRQHLFGVFIRGPGESLGLVFNVSKSNDTALPSAARLPAQACAASRPLADKPV